MTQKTEDLLQDLKKKIYHPLYLLEGEEPYFIDVISDYIERDVLPEAQRAFNQTILYGKDTSARAIRERAMNYPMFATQQVIIVKEAQMIKKWDDLFPYFEKPVKSTMLVLCFKHEKFDKRTKAAKSILANGVVMTSDKLWENQVPGWIEQQVKNMQLKISSEAAEQMAEYVGNDLSRIAHELEKLELNLKGRKEITVEDVQQNMGISHEYNTFQLNKALAYRDVLKANRIAAYFGDNKRANPLVFTLGSLYSYFSKIYLLHQSNPKSDQDITSATGARGKYAVDEYRTAMKNYTSQQTESVLSLLHYYDLRSKGVQDSGTDEASLLKELVYRILH